jgi:hypothetical protein
VSCWRTREGQGTRRARKDCGMPAHKQAHPLDGGGRGASSAPPAALLLEYLSVMRASPTVRPWRFLGSTPRKRARERTHAQALRRARRNAAHAWLPQLQRARAPA